MCSLIGTTTMTNNYFPDRWVVIKIEGDDPHYRILGGWRGGYAASDHWRLNSGIKEVTLNEDVYAFTGSSGSIYYCQKGRYGLTSLTSGIFDQLKGLHEDDVDVIPDDTDWLNMDWII